MSAAATSRCTESRKDTAGWNVVKKPSGGKNSKGGECMLNQKSVCGEGRDRGVEIGRCTAKGEETKEGNVGKKKGKNFIRQLLQRGCLD